MSAAFKQRAWSPRDTSLVSPVADPEPQAERIAEDVQVILAEIAEATTAQEVAETVRRLMGFRYSRVSVWQNEAGCRVRCTELSYDSADAWPSLEFGSGGRLAQLIERGVCGAHKLDDHSDVDRLLRGGSDDPWITLLTLSARGVALYAMTGHQPRPGRRALDEVERHRLARATSKRLGALCRRRRPSEEW